MTIDYAVYVVNTILNLATVVLMVLLLIRIDTLRDMFQTAKEYVSRQESAQKEFKGLADRLATERERPWER